MDQIPVVFDKEERNKVYELLADYYLKAIEAGKLNRYERQRLSLRIYESIDKARSLEEVVTFLEELTKEYAFFSPAALKLKEELNKSKEKLVVNKLQQYISSFK